MILPMLPDASSIEQPRTGESIPVDVLPDEATATSPKDAVWREQPTIPVADEGESEGGRSAGLGDDGHRMVQGLGLISCTMTPSPTWEDRLNAHKRVEGAAGEDEEQTAASMTSKRGKSSSQGSCLKKRISG